MRKKYKHGLIVGKFCPLHMGHIALFRFAKTQCDYLTVLSYTNPEFADFPSYLRQEWLASTGLIDDIHVLDSHQILLPSNHASNFEQREFVCNYFKSVHAADPNYIPIDVIFSSEAYGEGFANHMSTHYGYSKVAHCMFDQERKIVPISATKVRQVYYHMMAELTSYVPHNVRQQLKPKIAFIGAESTGKTTLAHKIAALLNEPLVDEYARIHVAKNNNEYNESDLIAIANTQVLNEIQLAKEADEFLVCDTTALTTKIYYQQRYGTCHSVIEHWANRSYAYVFLCMPDFLHVNDGTRMGDAFRQEMHSLHLQDTSPQIKNSIQLFGSIDQRICTVLEVLGKMP